MFKKEKEPGNFIKHTYCESCGSSDGNAIYDNNTSFCFVCSKVKSFNDKEKMEDVKIVNKDFTPKSIEYKNLEARKIKQSVAQKYSYGYTDGNHVCNYYDKNGIVVAQKFRTKDKSFSWIGNAKNVVLFGQNLFSPNKKSRIIITEGEIDALSIAQLNDAKWPVVSIPNGAASAVRDIQKHLEYLLGFKEVILAFDNDKAGRDAAIEVAKLFPPSFCKIANFTLKDANEMLKAGLEKQMNDSLWDAKVYMPEGIISGADVLSKLMNEEKRVSYPFPSFMEGTNQKTKGIRMGELDIYTSGTGSGKTTLIKQLQYHFYNTTEFNQALIHLEEPLLHTAKDLIGIALEERLNINEDVDKSHYLPKAEELFNAKDEAGFNRFYLMDNWGAMKPEDLFNKIRFLVKGLGCKIIWLDHLSILVSSLDISDDERRTIDFLMDKLKALTIELDCYIGLVVHLNNSTQKPFENGGIPTVNNLRGSGAIKQLSNQIYAFVRNQQSEDDIERNTSTFIVLKSRYTGNTGIADYLYYDSNKGIIVKGKKTEKTNMISQPSDFG